RPQRSCVLRLDRVVVHSIQQFLDAAVLLQVGLLRQRLPQRPFGEFPQRRQPLEGRLARLEFAAVPFLEELGGLLAVHHAKPPPQQCRHLRIACQVLYGHGRQRRIVLQKHAPVTLASRQRQRLRRHPSLGQAGNVPYKRRGISSAADQRLVVGEDQA